MASEQEIANELLDLNLKKSDLEKYISVCEDFSRRLMARVELIDVEKRIDEIKEQFT